MIYTANDVAAICKGAKTNSQIMFAVKEPKKGQIIGYAIGYTKQHAIDLWDRCEGITQGKSNLPEGYKVVKVKIVEIEKGEIE